MLEILDGSCFNVTQSLWKHLPNIILIQLKFEDTNRIPDDTEATYHRVIVFDKWGQLYDQNKFFYTHFNVVKLYMNGRKELFKQLILVILVLV